MRRTKTVKSWKAAAHQSRFLSYLEQSCGVTRTFLRQPPRWHTSNLSPAWRSCPLHTTSTSTSTSPASEPWRPPAHYRIPPLGDASLLYPTGPGICCTQRKTYLSYLSCHGFSYIL